jgi:ABC-type transporter Mla subunit MlaD
MRVDFTLPKKYDLRQDAIVNVEQALTGAANLNLTDFGHAAPLQAHTPLNGRPSAMGTLYAIAPEIQALVADVRAKVGPTYDRYDKTLANADGAVIEGKKAMVAFTDFLGGSGPDLRGTLANMNRATDTLNQRLPKTLDKADAFIDETKQAAAEARDTIKDAKAAMVAARDTIADAHAILTRNRSRIDNILSSARETANNLEGASAEIRRSPWRLLYKPSDAEVGNLALYDTTRQFARAAAQLNDAAGAVRDAAADPDVDRKTLDILMKDLQQTFGKYRQMEQALWQSVK